MPQTRSIVLTPLAALLTEQPFTFQMARDCGVGRKQLAAYVACGLVLHPIRNLYLPAQLPDTLELRARALALVVPPDCFVCDRTAAWLHGAPAAMAPNEHLTVPPVSCFRPSDHGRLRNGLAVSGERHVLSDDLMELHGIVTTTPLRTALDLGRLQRNPDTALAGLDAMLSLGVSHEQLLASVQRFAHQRGVVQLRLLAPMADGRAQSYAESALRRRWRGAGLPDPELQIPVLDGSRVLAWLDLGLEELLFAAEYDGEEFHSSDGDRDHDDGRRTWLTDCRGWHIEVFRKANVFGRLQDAEPRLRAAYEEARRSFPKRTVIL